MKNKLIQDYPGFEIVFKGKNLLAVKSIASKKSKKQRGKIPPITSPIVLLHCFEPTDAENLKSIGEEISQELAEKENYSLRKGLHAIKDFLTM